MSDAHEQPASDNPPKTKRQWAFPQFSLHPWIEIFIAGLGVYFLYQQNRFIESQTALMESQTDAMDRQTRLLEIQDSLFINQNNLVAAQTDLLETQNVHIAEQTKLFGTQNELFARQNTFIDFQTKLLREQNQKIDQQSILEESSRRSTTVSEQLALIIQEAKRELEAIPVDSPRVLSNNLIAWMAAWSIGVKPYRYLRDSVLTEKELSPERGQLLLAIVKMKLDTNNWKVIADRVTFDHADLKGVNLYFEFLKNVNLRGADLRGSFLFETKLFSADLREANLENTTLIGADLRSAALIKTNLKGANLNHVDLLGAIFWKYSKDKWHEPEPGANLEFASLNGAKNLTYDQLSEVSTLYGCFGIPPELEKELRAKSPWLFEEPK